MKNEKGNRFPMKFSSLAILFIAAVIIFSWSNGTKAGLVLASAITLITTNSAIVMLVLSGWLKSQYQIRWIFINLLLATASAFYLLIEMQWGLIALSLLVASFTLTFLLIADFLAKR